MSDLGTDGAKDEVPFSSGTEGADWMEAHCEQCVNDANGDCPLVAIAYAGFTPRQWTETNPFRIEDRYECSEFTHA